MRNVPVDQHTLMEHVTAVVGIDPVVDENGEQRRNGDDLPKWKIYMSRLVPGQRREEVVVGFGAEHPPEILPGSKPFFEGLEAMHWKMDNGSTGLALLAKSCTFTPSNQNGATAKKQPTPTA